MAKKKKKSGKAPKTETDEQSPASPPASETATGPAPRQNLILTVAFLAGAGLMTLEIVGGRVVAAHFGSHVFVWGGLIGIFMGALSAGYFFGGRLADRYPHVSVLGAGLLFAGGLVLLVPAVADPVCRIVGNALFQGNDELANRWNPALAIVLIFTGPALFLGSISPFTIRLLARDVATMGRVTARVYALNALGSIAGTLVTAFFLMGVMGNTTILILTGGGLILLGVLVVVTGTLGGGSPVMETPEAGEGGSAGGA
ncbi:MAG: fused MFS/spermidine synthase [Planctomycetota bacterium]|jgi:MFS family permease